jgi:hypothetical protein
MYTEVYSQNIKGREHFGGLDVGGTYKIILKYILKL